MNLAAVPEDAEEDGLEGGFDALMVVAHDHLEAACLRPMASTAVVPMTRT